MRKKKWVKPFLENENTYLIDKLDSTVDKIYLEIGMGMGDFIVESAVMNQDILYIGLEKDETCVARAIKKASENNVNNLRIMLKDASNIQELFKPHSIDCIYLHFSDPWPKKSHHKRRLTYPSFLTMYQEILKDEGKIIFKTDNRDFFLDSLEYFKESALIIEEINEDYHSELIGEPMTAYQRKFSELNQPIYYVRLLSKV